MNGVRRAYTKMEDIETQQKELQCVYPIKRSCFSFSLFLSHASCLLSQYDIAEELLLILVLINRKKKITHCACAHCVLLGIIL